MVDAVLTSNIYFSTERVTVSKNIEETHVKEVQSQPWLHRMSYKYAAAGFRGSQIVWKLSLLVKPMPESTWVRLDNDFLIFTSIADWNKNSIYKGQYERPLLQFLRMVEPQDLVIDVGANIGITTWSLAAKAGAGAYFLAIEPSPECFKELSQFMSLKGFLGKPLQLAAGDVTTTASLFGTENRSHSGGATLLDRHRDGESNISVHVLPLDKIIRDELLHQKDISIIKIDTEGFEGQVLAGSVGTLINNPPNILILEVSPMFGDISYLTDLWSKLSSDYFFYEIYEKGLFRRKLTLREVKLESTLNLTRQINLAVIKGSKVDELRTNRAINFMRFEESD